jgi:hypothetical protein
LVRIWIRLLSSVTLRMQKKKFSLSFSDNWTYNLILIKFLLPKFVCKILFCKYYFSPLNAFMIKGKDPNPDPYLWLMESDPDPGEPKTCGPCGSGSPTLA